jgi:outer membrane receptor for Fe3+-dicitrate
MQILGKKGKIMQKNHVIPHKLSKSALAVVISTLFSTAALSAQSQATSQNEPAEAASIETIEIQGKATSLIGEAISASEGIIGQQEILNRPMLRTGEILELVPGMVVTQHSGTGKANQYFFARF